MGALKKVGIILAVIVAVIISIAATAFYLAVEEVKNVMDHVPANDELERTSLKSVPHMELLENVDLYLGETVRYQGTVMQSTSIDDDTYAVLVEVDGGLVELIVQGQPLDKYSHVDFFGRIIGSNQRSSSIDPAVDTLNLDLLSMIRYAAPLEMQTVPDT